MAPSTTPAVPAFDAARYNARRFTGCLEVMDQHEGDVKIMWSVDNLSEVEVAREFFAMCQANGMLTYAVPKDGTITEGEQVREFDPTTEARIIATPQPVGG